MSCIYEDFETGICQMFDSEIEMPGCDETGICICSSDEDPTYLCEYYSEE